MASTPSVNAVEAAVAEPPVESVARVGRYRWVICALLFFATTINYVDRQVMGILAKDLQNIIGWSEIDYGNVVAAFNAAYALGLLVSGLILLGSSDSRWMLVVLGVLVIVLRALQIVRTYRIRDTTDEPDDPFASPPSDAGKG